MCIRDRPVGERLGVLGMAAARRLALSGHLLGVLGKGGKLTLQRAAAHSQIAVHRIQIRHLLLSRVQLGGRLLVLGRREMCIRDRQHRVYPQKLAARPIRPKGSDRKYREISEKLGNIILKANVDAESIVAEAETEAAQRLSEAEKNADELRLDSAVSARLMTSQVREKLIAMTDEYISNLRTVSDDSIREYRKLYEELQEKFEAMGMKTKENASISQRSANTTTPSDIPR